MEGAVCASFQTQPHLQILALPLSGCASVILQDEQPLYVSFLSVALCVSPGLQ